MSTAKPLIIAILVFSALAYGQEQPPRPEPAPLFVKATFFPTFSLSRYDYNLDRNRRELRAYIELREDGIQGRVVPDAQVWVNGEAIVFNRKHGDYRKRILRENPNRFSREIHLRIARDEANMLNQKVVFPGWVKITSPQPQILASVNGLEINWTFSANAFPLVLNIEDTRQRRKLRREFREPGEPLVLTEKEIPENTILRIWIATDWFFKKYLSGKYIVKGSEINVMPWSQVFLRTAPLKANPK